MVFGDWNFFEVSQNQTSMEVVEDQMEIHIHYQDAIKMDYWGREDVFGIWSQINILPT